IKDASSVFFTYVIVYPAKAPSLQHHSLLVCPVSGFYPGHTETLVMFETVPQSGVAYTCHVDPSLTNPVTVD
ncbi:hypothetical protein J0S82_007480, partial [Galemys pyrenaicus]